MGIRAGAAIAAMALIGASSAALAAVHGTRSTEVIAANANGPSRSGTFSQDGRRVQYYAFTSLASNLVPNDNNGRQDVFVLRRGASPGSLGGALQRVSVSSAAGRPTATAAVRRSTATRTTPHCVAFAPPPPTSRRDAHGDASHVFLRNLRTRRTDARERGPVGRRDPVIDGACEFVTYDVAGTVFLRDLAGRPHLPDRLGRAAGPADRRQGRGVRARRPGLVPGFQKIYNHGHPKVVLRGGERLVSEGAHGPGNGSSLHPSVSDNGDYVAFESTATNLCDRRLPRHLAGRERRGQRRLPPHDDPRRADARPDGDGELLAGRARAGQRAEQRPDDLGSGQFIAFDSAADNLRPRLDPRRRPERLDARHLPLVRAGQKRGAGNVSRESRPGPKGAFNGPSMDPALSSHGNYLAFASNEIGELPHDGSVLPKVLMRYLGGK